MMMVHEAGAGGTFGTDRVKLCWAVNITDINNITIISISRTEGD